MKALIPFFILLFLVTSCTSTPEKKIQAKVDYDTLPLPTDSTTLYFKTKPDYRDTTSDAVTAFVNSWFSKMLFALKEPVLKDYQGDKEIYRFTWLRSFNHPVAIRLEKQSNIVRIFSKVCGGAGGYEPGKVIFDTTFLLTQKEVDGFNERLEAAKYWSMQTENNVMGNDGSEWILEVFKNGFYHMVVRWSPFDEIAFRKIGEYLLSISQIKNETDGHGNY